MKRRPGRALSSARRRLLLAAVLLAVAFYPVASPAVGQPAPPGCAGCHQQSANAERWIAPLAGAWTAGGANSATAGTTPLAGQAYVAVGGGLAVVGTGLMVTSYALADGSVQWLTTLLPRDGATIISVRAWPGVITVGVLGFDGTSRTEVVLDAVTGAPLRRYPAALFGGAVAASAATTAVIGRTTVTGYDNKTGRIRWRHHIPAGSPWRVDGRTLYLAEAKGGAQGTGQVTDVREINTDTGGQQLLGSPPYHPFAGTLATVANGVLVFTSVAGVTAYSAATGGPLWTMHNAVPEGTDPGTGMLYVTSASGALTAVDPLTGTVRGAVSGSTAGGSAGIYVVRGGVALGLDSGAGGEAWGYNVSAGRVTWTAQGLPWPHYFSDVSGLGGSAATDGDVAVITACPHLTPAATPTPTPASSSPLSSPTASPSASLAPPQSCADPELVALRI